MKKRLFTVLMTLCMLLQLLSVSAMAAGTELSIESPKTLPAVGQTFTVTVDISGNPGLAAAQFTLGFDRKVVDCTDVSAGTVLDGMMAATNPDASAGAIVAAAAASESKGDGTLATYTFTVVGRGDPKFDLTKLVLSRQNGDAVTCTVKNAATGESAQPETPTAPPAEEKPTEQPVETPAQPPEVITPAPESEHRFTDTKGHWAEAYIHSAVDAGLFGGYADGSFRPGNAVTRGAFVTVLWRMAGRPAVSGTTPFTDIGHVSAEFRTAITWAYENGYVGGRTDTTFAPGDPVSRQAAMKILFGFSGGQSGMELTLTPVYNSAFSDSAKLPAWAVAPMYWGVYNGIISGTSDGRLNGSGTATRAQLAKILSIYAEKFN